MKESKYNFEKRHIAIDEKAKRKMLKKIGYDTLNQLIDTTIPPKIRSKNELQLPEAMQETEFLEKFRKVAAKNKVFKNYIGQGHHPSHLPTVIQRNVFENPGWYTSYTPYQAEISQGRLEALINFQTMVCDLTAMPIANASLLDESTALAEAVSMMYNAREKDKKSTVHILVDEDIYPQNLAVVNTRAEPLGIKVETGKWTEYSKADMGKCFALVVQFPNLKGLIADDYIKKIKKWQENGVKIIVAADIMSLTICTPPGEYNADVAVGTTQRLGIPLGYGGPSAAYFACQEKYKRQIPGRIIGVSMDKNGDKAYRMALQTREQHIKRERATSNICTAQALLATIAGLYAVYHGPNRLLEIGQRINCFAVVLRDALANFGYKPLMGSIFDTVTITDEPKKIAEIQSRALASSVNFNYNNDRISVSINETTTKEDLEEIIATFDINNKYSKNLDDYTSKYVSKSETSASMKRTTKYLQHPVFNKYHCEHEMLRYLKRLENKDISLTHSMIPLGSCTMKLNATSEMIPLSWSFWGNMHPYAPLNQVSGYQDIIKELGHWLAIITGFKAVSFQPNSGAQGEYAGLWVIDKYHKSKQDFGRDVVFIPQSAHGTNPATSVMLGKKVVIIKCLDKGEIDISDLSAKIDEYPSRLCALMVTYPSTRGVFDNNIIEVCEKIHDAGGQVYMDGANMNAQIGLTSPALIGADVCHLNLHKTFAIPHGGGGPGMGPICCASHLAPFLPEDNSKDRSGFDSRRIQWSSTVHGSASILAISYAYIAMMGAKGMKAATEVAILNANYIKARLEGHYDILFTGDKGCVAHELIVDCRQFRDKNVLVEDIAKRLIDYGFHAPTVSFPIVGALMIEPTESESMEELDRFCDAMISIKGEIDGILAGDDDNVLKNAPHTASDVISGEWGHPYTREQAAFPLPYTRERKYWSPVARIDNAYGDRNLFCTCPVIDE